MQTTMQKHGVQPSGGGSGGDMVPAANLRPGVRRWARVALYALASLGAMLAIVLTLILTTDLGRFRSQIESAVTEALGRDFAIEGELNVLVDLGRIRVSASGIRLAGTAWSDDADLVHIGRFAAVVDSWSLIGRPIRIENFELEQARVNLQRDESGTANWAFLAPENDVSDEDAGPPGDLPVIVDLARIVDVALVYNSPDRAQPLRFSIAELAVEADDEDYLALRLDAALNDTPAALDVRAGPVANLVEYRDVAFDIEGRLGEIILNAEATIDSLLQPRRPTLRLTVSGPSAEYLSDRLNVEPVTSGPLELTASIVPLGNGMQLSINGDFGEFANDISGRFQDLQTLEDISLRAALSGPNANVIANLLGNPDVPPDPFSIAARFTRSGAAIDIEEIAVNVGESRFVAEAQIADFRRPAGASGRVRIHGPDFGRFNRLFGLPGKLTGPFDMEIDFEPQSDSSASVRIAANAEDLQFTIGGSVANSPDLSGTTFRMDFAGPDFRTVTDALGLANAPPEPFAFGVDVARMPEGIDLSNGAMTIGDDRFGFAGIVGNAPLEADTDISFDAYGPNLSATLMAFGLDADELPDDRFRADGRIERARDGFVLHDVSVAVGENLEYELSVAGTVVESQDLIGTRVEVRVAGIDLGAMTDAMDINDIPNVPFEASASLERVERGFAVSDGRARLAEDTVEVNGLIGQTPLERDTNLRFAATAKDLRATLTSFGIDAGAVPAGAFEAAGEIRSRNSRFRLRDVTASLAGANASLSGELGAMPSLDGTDVVLEVSGDNLARLLPEDEKYASLTDPYRLSASVRVLDGLLALRQVTMDLPGFEATATMETGLTPVMSRGRFTIAVSSPDILPLTRRAERLVLADSLPLRLTSSGHWGDGRFTLDELDFRLARGTLTGSGTLGSPPRFEGTDITVDLNVASLQTLSMLAGRGLPDDAAQFEFHLSESDGVMRLERFDGSFGDSDFSGEFEYRNADVPEMHIRLASTRLNLSPYLGTDDEAGDESAPSAGTDGRLIPNTPIPLEALKKIAATVNVDIDEINMGPETFTGVVLVGSLADGALSVNDFALSNNVGGSLRGQFMLRPVGDTAVLSLDVAGTNMVMGMTAETEEEFARLPRYELETVLTGSGATTREIASSLNGYLRLTGGEGRFRALAIKLFTGDFLSEVLTTVNPFVKRDPYTNLQCAAALVQVENGVAVGNPMIVIQSDRLSTFSNAKLNLNTETIDADIRTVPRKGLGFSVSDLVNPYIKLGGTFANPTLNLDPEGVLIDGGIAVATAGVSILAKRFKERFLDAQDACGKAVSDAEPKFAELREKYRSAAPPD